MNHLDYTEQIVRGDGRDGIDHVCVKKLTPRQGRIRYSKRWIPSKMPEGQYWAGREMDLINLLSIKRVPHVVELVSYSRLEEDRERFLHTETIPSICAASASKTSSARMSSVQSIRFANYRSPGFNVESAFLAWNR